MKTRAAKNKNKFKKKKLSWKFLFLLIYRNIYLNNEIVWVTFTLGGAVNSYQIKFFLIKRKHLLVILTVQPGVGIDTPECRLQHFWGCRLL